MARAVMKVATVLYLILVGLLFVLVLVSREVSFVPIIFCAIYCFPFTTYATVKVIDLYPLEFPEEKSIWWGHVFSTPSSPREESPELKFWQCAALLWQVLFFIPAVLLGVANFSL
ncbi:MAG: hypothetical protein HFF09_07380 [Oscillospiraceae bacterium]|nr:hypothetical protein [Oscillospiraceae bacterium]